MQIKKKKLFAYILPNAFYNILHTVLQILIMQLEFH